jgi:transposase
VVQAQLENFDGTVARLAAARCTAARELTVQILALEKEITALIQDLTPTLLQVPGCAGLTAAKIVGETAGITRFHSPDAYARHNGTAPLPVWSSNVPRHRLSRNRQPTAQRRAASHRLDPGPSPPSSPNADRPAKGVRQERQGSATHPQTAPVQTSSSTHSPPMRKPSWPLRLAAA